MEFLAVLWLPILVAAVLVFVASSVMHMVVSMHWNDYAQLPGEEKVREAMRAEKIAPGMYAFPRPSSMKEMAEPAMLEKYRTGPVGFMTVLPTGVPAFGKNLVQWFLYSVLIGVFVAYLGNLALERGAPYLEVFRVTGTVGILAYAVEHIHDSIWRGQSWSVTGKFVFDGVIYGLLTAAAFAWLWPAAV